MMSAQKTELYSTGGWFEDIKKAAAKKTTAQKSTKKQPFGCLTDEDRDFRFEESSIIIGRVQLPGIIGVMRGQ